MSSPLPRPLWRGRSLALVAIVLLSLNLRTAVGALSPIVERIREDLPLDPVALGLIGMLAPAAFAASGAIGPALARRIGLEGGLVAACALMLLGPVTRALAPDVVVLVGGTLVTFVGMGIGNVLLPPAVKRYFPDRIRLVTAVYVTMLAISTTVPAAFAVPVAEHAGWRVSLVVWGAIAVVAAVPWLVLWARQRRATALADAPELLVPAAAVERVHRSGIAVTVTLVFTVSALNAYSMFAWLPQLLVDHAGASDSAAGALLALFAILGLPFALIAPALAARERATRSLVHLATLAFVVGYGGLLIAPSIATWVWVFFAGSGPAILFPVALVLINSRTRSTESSAATSGFVQGVGYSVAALGPLSVGILHDVTGSWSAPLVVLLATGLLASLAALRLRRPGFIDDELA